jgi:hypothetical protein
MGHCDKSVSAGRSKPFAGFFGGLPNGFVRIVRAYDGENLIALANLSGFLPRKVGGTTGIIVYRLQTISPIGPAVIEPQSYENAKYDYKRLGEEPAKLVSRY